MKTFKSFLLMFLVVLICLSPVVSLKAVTDWSKFHHQYFFAFNKALLKNDLELQQRGVVSVKRVSFAASMIPRFQVNSLIEPALSFEDYSKKPVNMKVSKQTDRQITLEEFVEYITTITHQLDNRAFPQLTGSYDPRTVIFILFP